MKNAIVITVEKRTIYVYLVLSIVVGVILFFSIYLTADLRSNYVTVEGYCKDISGHNITINAATYESMFSFSQDTKDAFEGHNVRLEMFYSEKYDCYFWESIERI